MLTFRGSEAALLNRWAAKLLQVGREMFRDNLNIFWKKLLVDTNCIFLENVMNYESPEVKVSRNAVPVKELLPVRRSGQNF